MALSKGYQTRPKLIGLSLSAALALLCFLLLLAPSSAVAASPSIRITPAVAPVGAQITIGGTGFPPNASLSLHWTTWNASWIIKAIPTPQVTGVTNTPYEKTLATVQTNASGAFSLQTTVPTDYGGAHAIRAYLSNGTSLSPVNSFTLVPNFRISSSNGPAESPIRVTATGLGTGVYSTNYHLYWDNSYVGYVTGLTTGGVANFTFYASGAPGIHYITIYEGYPGPGYLVPTEGSGAGTPAAASVYWPPYIPFNANFTVTGASTAASPAAFQVPGSAAFGSFAILAAALASGAFFILRKEPEKREAISRTVVAVVIIALVVIAGIGVYVASTSSSSSSSSQTSSSQTSTSSQIPSFAPAAIVVRPQINVPQSGVSSGPRIGISQNIAGVGDNVSIKGTGFAPGSQLPLVFTTRQGNNILGWKIVSKPLKNITADADGTFATSWKVPPMIGGVHFIAAGNLTRNSNATLFVQRTASLNVTRGPVGTKIQVTVRGVGWTFNTNIAALDYDNAYLGYSCGFTSGGNVTFTIRATGSPGVHTIDVYPSVWWGPSHYQNQSSIEYRYPLLTPHDHPELMPSFHFTFLVTP